MGSRDEPRRSSELAPHVAVVGLGPGEAGWMSETARRLLDDPDRVVVLRTLDHPAAVELAEERTVVSCDDLYSSGENFEDVYRAITDRVMTAAQKGPVAYAVPGSPLVGETSVRWLSQQLLETDFSWQVLPAESFVDAIVAQVGIDPLFDGLRILDGRDLPDPLVLDAPSIVGHLDLPVVLANATAALQRVLPEGAPVTVLIDLKSATERVVETTIDAIDPELAGYRTSIFINTEPGGLIGAIRTMRQLRAECPWDQKQTHHSIVRNLIEETYELAHALSMLPQDAPAGPPDFGAYADVEDELGDVLLQVLFQTTMAAEAGAFDIDDVAEVLRSKLVRRHPHVFGDVEVDSAEEVKDNWDRIKAGERHQRSSALDGVPTDLSGITRSEKLQDRAAKIGFDWPEPAPVFEKLAEEIGELAEATGTEVGDEVGDVLFTVVNLARHLSVDPEVAIRRASDRFESRFRNMELSGPLEGLSLDELDARWEAAKGLEIQEEKEDSW